MKDKLKFDKKGKGDEAISRLIDTNSIKVAGSIQFHSQ